MGHVKYCMEAGMTQMLISSFLDQALQWEQEKKWEEWKEWKMMKGKWSWKQAEYIDRMSP